MELLRWENMDRNHINSVAVIVSYLSYIVSHGSALVFVTFLLNPHGGATCSNWICPCSLLIKEYHPPAISFIGVESFVIGYLLCHIQSNPILKKKKKKKIPCFPPFDFNRDHNLHNEDGVVMRLAIRTINSSGKCFIINPVSWRLVFSKALIKLCWGHRHGQLEKITAKKRLLLCF